MPEHIRALLVILALATAVFAFARAPACSVATTAGDFARRRNLWVGLVLTAFLAHNYWIYIIVAAMLLLYVLPREPNKLAMYFFLLFALPVLTAEIPGMGIIRFFFEISYPRLLSMTVLFPAFLYLRQQPDSARFGQLLPDKLITGYLVLICALTLSASTFTHALRSGVFYAFIDVFLPYYVASRSLKNLQGFRDALMAFVLAAMVLCMIAVFEFGKHWLLFSNLNGALGVGSSYGFYLERGDGVLRAQASAGHAIPLGYVIAVATGFFLYLTRSIPNAMHRRLGMLLLIAGLIAPVSRGPWVGAAVIVVVLIATGRSAATGFLKLGIAGVIALPVLLMFPFGRKILELLPFVTATVDHTVIYRQQLLQATIGVVMQSPFFGAYDYMYSPAMQALRQGEGIVDIVNSYIGVALSSGLVGLSLFSGSFIVVAFNIFRAMLKLADKSDERYLLGQALLAVLIGIMVMIFTVSSISIIPLVYWSVIGLGVAYARMLAPATAPAKVATSANARAGGPGLSPRLQPTAVKQR